MSARLSAGHNRSGRFTTTTRPGPARPGFSLVELLTVVGIIALLIGILLPTMQAARTEAKRGATRAFLASCERGLEMFNTDFGQYPNSQRRPDPVEYPDDSGPAYLSGAHWLARALIGHDGNGVDYGAKGMNGAPGSLKWVPGTNNGHLFTPSPLVVHEKRRKAYVENAVWKKDSEISTSMTSNGPVGRDVFLDNFEHPVIYYRANSRASVPFGESYAKAGGPVVYMQEDNSEITGGAVESSSVTEGWVLTAAGGKLHGMGQFGLSGTTLTVKADNHPKRTGFTFAGALHNASAYQSAKTLKAAKDTSFILMSPGPDGVFGTADDVSNFK